MAFPNYVPPQLGANPYQIAGQAATQLGGRIQEFGDNRDKMRMAYEEMVQKRKDKILADQRTAEEFALKKNADERAAAEAQRQADLARSREQFLKDFTGADMSDPANQAKAKSALAAGVIDPQTFRTLVPEPEKSPADVQEYRFYAEQEKTAGRQPLSYQEYRLSGRKAGATTVNVGGEATESLGKQIGKNLANEVDKLNDEAATARATIPIVRNAMQLVDRGIVSGSFANQRLGIARALATLTGIGEESVSNTDEFLASTAQQVAQNIKNFGAGTGLSDADREFAQKMAGGNIETTPQAILRILKINEKLALGKIQRYNARRATLIKNNPDVEGYYEPIDVDSLGGNPGSNENPKAKALRGKYNY